MPDLRAHLVQHFASGVLADDRRQVVVGVVEGEPDLRAARLPAGRRRHVGAELVRQGDGEVVPAVCHTVGGLLYRGLVQVQLARLHQRLRHLIARVQRLTVYRCATVLVDQRDRHLADFCERIPVRPQIHRAVEQRQQNDRDQRDPRHGAARVPLEVRAERHAGQHRYSAPFGSARFRWSTFTCACRPRSAATSAGSRLAVVVTTV